MKDPKDLTPDFSDLRRRAEERLEVETISPEELSPGEAARLIHELQVHQIELELQNEELRLAQVQLAESRNKYADLYDFAPMGYLTLDKTGKIVEANLTAATMLGLERSKLLDRYFPLFLMETDPRVFRQLLNDSSDLQKRRGEFHLQDGKGEGRVMLLDILLLEDAEGRERRRVAMTDITELKRTQEELRLHKEELEELVVERTAELIEVNEQLREANDNLQALFAAAPLAIGVFDAEGKVVSVNPASEHIFGWSLEEVQGRLPLSIPAEKAEESLAVLHRVLKGESFVGAEITQQRKDGSPVEVSFSAAPLHGAAGGLRGFIGLAEDITERKRTEEAVRTQARVLESMAEAVTVTDDRGHILYTNPAFDAMFGYKPGELLGRHSNVLNFYPPEENTRVVKDILEEIQSTGAWFGEFHNCKKKGSPFYTSARISALEVGDKKLFISVQEDITERKRAEEMLRRQAELLDLAHDAIVVKDPQGRIMYWNQGATNHYGWPKEVALKKNVHRLLKTAFPQPLPEIERLLLEQGYWEGELAHTNIQGQRLVMSSRWTLKRDDEGRVVAILEISQDITAQKQIEEEIHRLASFPLLNPHPVLEADEKGKVTYANPAARQVADKLRLDEGVQAFLPPDLKKIFAAARKGGPREYSFDKELGEAVYAITLHLPHDLPTVRLYAMEVTERRRAEAALRESEERLRLALDAAYLISFEWDIQRNEVRRFVSSDPALALTPERAPSTFEAVREVVYPEDRALFTANVFAAMEHEYGHYENEFRIVHPDGEIAWLYERGFVQRDGKGRPARLIGLSQDITKRKRAEEALRESREDLNRAQAVAHVGSWRLDVRKNELTWSDENHRIFGIPKGTPLSYESFLAVIHPEDREFVDQKWTRALRGEAYDIEHRLIVDGQVKWVRERAELELDDHGQLSSGFGTTQDITERRRAEEALREREAKLASILATAPVGIGLVLNRVILEVNQQLCQMTGYAPEELLEKSSHLLYATQEEFDYVGLEKYRQMEEHCCGTVETRWLRQDGEIIEVLLSSSLLVPGDPASGVTFTALDITERKRAEEALRRAHDELEERVTERTAALRLANEQLLWEIEERQETAERLQESEARFSAFMKHLPGLAVMRDVQGTYVFANEAWERLMGKTRDDWQGKNLQELWPQKTAQRYQQLDQQVLLAGEPVEALETLEMADGPHHYLSYRFPIKDLDGLPYMVGAIGIDVTARQRAEEALAAERQRFFNLLDNLPAFIYLQDRDYKVKFANRQFRERFGKPEGKACYTLFRGSEAPCPECPTFQVLHTGKPVDWEWQAPDGRIYQIYDYPFEDVDGSPLVLEMGLDITAKKQAEEEALHQTRLFEAFFDHAITPLVFLDPQFNFIRVNQAYARACHREVEDFIGRNHFNLYPHEENQAIFQEVVETKQPFVAIAKGFEFPDHPEWGISYWDWSLVPIVDEAGEVDFLVFSLNDVTEQVLAEEERRRLVEILENTTDFVGIADFYGNLQYLNRAGRAMVGVGQDEDVRQLKVLQLHPDRFGELILLEGSPTARWEGSWQAEIALLHRDGREIPVSQVILAHKDTTGRVQFFSTIARDISDLKQAQENILRQSAVLNGINRIFREALTTETPEELGNTCLAVTEDLTDSPFGFLGELNEEGVLNGLAFSNPGWDLCNMPNTVEPQHLKDIKPVGLLARSIREGKTMLTNDPASHPDAAGIPAGHPPLTAFLGVPLVFGERTIGLIGLGNKPGGYTLNDQETLETLAPSIVEALMHHQAKRDLQRSESKLRHLADQLLTAQENERKRLAAELHDELGHALLTLKLALSSIAKELLPGQESIAEEIKEQLAYITDVIGEVRRLYHDLSPGDVEDLGLTKALRTLIEDFAIHLPHINWKVDLPDLEGLFSQPVQTIIYRLVQEALTNIGKHANPEHVNVSAVNEGSQVHFVIGDDGAGFDLVEVLESASGLGLVAMEERLNMLGGTFVVRSKKREGTRLSFSIPTLPEDER